MFLCAEAPMLNDYPEPEYKLGDEITSKELEIVDAEDYEEPYEQTYFIEEIVIREYPKKIYYGLVSIRERLVRRIQEGREEHIKFYVKASDIIDNKIRHVVKRFYETYFDQEDQAMYRRELKVVVGQYCQMSKS